MNMGKPGAFGSRYSNFIIQNSDFYLSIGSRLPYMVTGYNSKDFARAAKTKVMVDIDKFELVKKDMNIDYKICCDAKLFISQLSYYFKKQIQINKWLNYCNRLKKNFPILDKKNFNKKKYVNSYRFVNTLSANLPNSSTIVTDMGFSFTTTHQAFMNKKNQSLFTNSGHAPMGWGLPAAVGAASDYKKFNKVICLTGEGGFQMNLQELATVMHNKIPLKIFIFNNGGYLTIKQTQILGFNGRLMGSTKSSGIAFPDYSKIASSHDIDYFRIDNHKKLKNKIKQILKINKPIICELMMDPNEEQIPKAINKKDNQGRSVPTVFEDMYPFLKKKIIMESKYE
jgi:acetolactate synthase I/II/III large subunit